MKVFGEVTEQPANVFEIHRTHSLSFFRLAELLDCVRHGHLRQINVHVLFVVSGRFDKVWSAKDGERSGKLVSDRMQRESGPGNRTFRFDVDLLFTACQFQRFHVAVCKALRNVVRFTLGKVELGEILSLPSGGSDVTHAIVQGSPVLDPVNLDRRVAFFDRDRELVF